VNGAVDTVILFIEVVKPVIVEEPVIPVEKQNQKMGQGNDPPKIKDSRFIDMELPNPNLQVDSSSKNTADVITTEKKIPGSYGDSAATDPGTKKRMINPDCKKTAEQNDFLNLRKQMAAEQNESDMIKVANKQFISICFTTEQIKNLGTLFITEGERYKFFVAAFPYVSDSKNYGLLEDQLTDKYYISRFNAMIRN